MRRNFGDGREIGYQDLNAITTALERSLYDRTLFEILLKSENAFFGTGLKVAYLGATSVTVLAGLGFQTDNTAVSPEPTKKPLYRSTNVTRNLQAPDAADPRIDIVVARYALVDAGSESRKYKDPISSVVTSVSSVITRDEEAEIIIVAGTPAPSPVAPAVPAGYTKLAELTVPAVGGMSGAGNVTDSRIQMPIGPYTPVNTAGFFRLTAGVSVPMQTLMADIDALLRRPRANYIDVERLDTSLALVAPGSPAANHSRYYERDGVLYRKDELGVTTPVGSGGGGGAGAAWWQLEGEAPNSYEEYGYSVFGFGAGLAQKLVLWLRVPDSYLVGRAITAKLGLFSPSASGTVLLQTTTTLIRKNTDAVDSVVNSYVSTNAAITNTVAKQLREITVDISEPDGQVNNVTVNPGDLLKVVLSRATDTDTGEVRFIPTATEIKFS